MPTTILSLPCLACAREESATVARGIDRHQDGHTCCLPTDVEAAIENQAKTDAGVAMLEGATAPWGDGETIPDVNDLLRTLPPEMRPGPASTAERRVYAQTYDRFFRAEIDRLGALVEPEQGSDADDISDEDWGRRYG